MSDTCKHPRCGKRIVRCDTLPSHCGCSSACGWIHAVSERHFCGVGPAGLYARPAASAVLAQLTEKENT